jgi:hypothetical protein
MLSVVDVRLSPRPTLVTATDEPPTPANSWSSEATMT